MNLRISDNLIPFARKEREHLNEEEIMQAMPLFFRSKVVIAVLGLIAVLIALRIALPHYLLNYVNRTLHKMEDYRGRVEDIRVHLWRGAYEIIGLKLVKTAGEVPVPFLDVKRVDLSVQWSELIHGAAVGEVTFIEPQINFVKGPTKRSSQTEIGKSWIDVTEELVPFSLNRLRAVNGSIHYRDFQSDPKVNIYLDRVYLEAENLTNSQSVAQSEFATLHLYNKPGEKDPEVDIRADLDTFAKTPTFHLKFSLKGLDLTRLNDFLRAYGNFDVQKGTFQLYSEIDASGGKYDGYVKPLFKNLDVVDWKKEKKGPLKLAWEAIVGAAASLLTSEETGRVATNIPIRGNFENKNVDYWAAIGNLLKNAFIQAIRPGFQRNGDDNRKSEENKK